MSEHHLLKTLLNIHLASDASAALHLPYILNIISPEYLTPSAHLSKWTGRIQGLLHSKESRGRWAGLVLAQRTATLSQPLLSENGQAWTEIALPLISKNDSTVVLKAAIRLLRTIFSLLHGLSEFRRQVAVPNIPKLLAALIPLIEQTDDIELKVISLKTLATLIPLYPSLHKPSYPTISGLALRFLDGHPSAALPFELLAAASRLYSVSHVTGGKVGASSLWRKTFDETLAFGTNAFWSLRTTFGVQPPVHVSVPQNEDPVVHVPQQLDKLKCAITILDDLLGTTVYRPVPLPLGVSVRFALQLMKITSNFKGDDFVDPTTYTLESSVMPKIQVLGCTLIVSLAQRVDRHLLPHLTQIMTVLTIQLEQQNTTKELRSDLLHTIEVLLRLYPSSSSSLISTRLTKAVLPTVSRLLASSGSAYNTGDSGPAKARKGKKRARVYEGDELFSSARLVLCPTDIDGKVLLSALEVIRLLLRDPHLSTTMQTISARVLLAIQFALVRIPPATLSHDSVLFRGVLDKLHRTSTEFASGTSNTLSRSLPLIIAVLTHPSANDVELQRQLDLLLHPRLPPLMRSMPLTENLSLIFSEEPEGQADLRKSLGLFTRQEIVQQIVDVELEESKSPATSFAQQPRTTLTTTTLAPPKSIPLPAQPGPVPPLPSPDDRPTQKEKFTPDSEPNAAQFQKLPEEHLPVPFRSSVIEAPIIQSFKLASGISQARPPTPTPGPPDHSTPTNIADDEDEEMPGIDLDSDSDSE